MKIRGIQFCPNLGDVEKNIDVHVKHIKEAVKDKIDLIIFPELSISGYHLKDIVYDVSLTPGDEIIKDFEKMSRDIDILIGAPYEEIPGIIYNSALFFSQGKLIHNHRKVQLPNFGMFEEGMIFANGDSFRTFKVGEFTAGIIICREILFPIHAYLYYLQGVDFLIGISNSPVRGMNKDGFSASFKLWERLGEVYAVHYHQNYVFMNRTGFEESLGFGGGSFFAAPGQGILTRAAPFDDDILDFEINKEDVRASRISTNYLRDEKPEIILKELKRIINA